MSQPKITIIVPVFNVYRELPYCIRSILNQSYTNLEILLIDDGSTDKSPALCDEYGMSDNRIKVFHKANSGLSDTRNFGIERATGDFFLFIDSDDILHNDFCKILISTQEKYGADIVSLDLVNFHSHEEMISLDKCKNTPIYICFKGDDILSEYFNPKERRIIYHGLCMKLYKKELFKILRFQKGRLHEDLYITYKLLDLCNIFVFINLPYYYYYQNPNSITHNYREKNLIDEYEALDEIKSYSYNTKIKKDLNHFVLLHYYMLIQKTYNFPKDKKILLLKKQMKEWINRNIKYTDDLSIPYKAKILLVINFHFIYKIIRYLKSHI